MASITIRNINDDTKHALRLQAAHAGMPLETYVRRLLETQSAQQKPEKDLAALAKQYFGSKYGVSLDIPARTTHRSAIDFE